MVCTCPSKDWNTNNATLLIAISSGLIAFFPSLDVLTSLLPPNGWVGYVVTIPLWFLGTMGISFFLPQQRTPKVWGVPMVPWFPSLSIATNLFLMGSLEPQAFIRFGICTGKMLGYYILVGLHATYDMAHQQQKLEA
ncbi:hypothetical protein CRYUN_Cryun04dG0001600 [Craigia yunnanensis]